MNPKLKIALLSMGYRCIGSHKWAKPVGFHVFTYEEDREEWTNWFFGKDQNIHRWDAKTLSDNVEKRGSYVSQLKEIEAYSKINTYASATSKFSFLTDKQRAELLLDGTVPLELLPDIT
jgi:hypothetical protein